MGYTFEFLQPGHPYRIAWQARRRCRNQLLIAMAAWLPATIALAIPLTIALQSEVPAFVAFAITSGTLLVLWQRFLFWPCPHCERPFSVSLLWASPFRDRCAHCGLEKHAPCNPTEQNWELAGDPHAGSDDQLEANHPA